MLYEKEGKEEVEDKRKYTQKLFRLSALLLLFLYFFSYIFLGTLTRASSQEKRSNDDTRSFMFDT